MCLCRCLRVFVWMSSCVCVDVLVCLCGCPRVFVWMYSCVCVFGAVECVSDILAFILKKKKDRIKYSELIMGRIIQN